MKDQFSYRKRQFFIEIRHFSTHNLLLLTMIQRIKIYLDRDVYIKLIITYFEIPVINKKNTVT